MKGLSGLASTRAFTSVKDHPFVKIEFDEVDGKRSGVAWLRLNRPEKVRSQQVFVGTSHLL